MFSFLTFKDIYSRFLGPLARPVTLLVNNGTTFDPYSSKAHVTKYNESDLVAGGSIELGDLKLIILGDDMPDGVTSLGLKDRIAIEDRQYAIIHWDQYTRTIGDNDIAIEATIRGGGVYIP